MQSLRADERPISHYRAAKLREEQAKAKRYHVLRLGAETPPAACSQGRLFLVSAGEALSCNLKALPLKKSSNFETASPSPARSRGCCALR